MVPDKMCSCNGSAGLRLQREKCVWEPSNHYIHSGYKHRRGIIGYPGIVMLILWIQTQRMILNNDTYYYDRRQGIIKLLGILKLIGMGIIAKLKPS